MSAERTFWEKATAIHVFCKQGAFDDVQPRSRHWYDLSKLRQKGVAKKALADKQLALNVATHKNLFFKEKDTQKVNINYVAAVNGNLLLIPWGDALRSLEADYREMVDAGMFLEEPPTFSALMASCSEIERQANARRA
jgi:Nucleotidyl transferase AbiEii toxin, Type IV TA system